MRDVVDTDVEAALPQPSRDELRELRLPGRTGYQGRIHRLDRDQAPGQLRQLGSHPRIFAHSGL
jgi:hypothetical protein